MSIRARAEKTGSGILLTGIESRVEAEKLCTFFRERGTAATIPARWFSGRLRVFLVSISSERFAECIDEAGIELIP